MSMPYTPKQREKAIKAVITGLSIGTPLAVICRAEAMPSHDAISDWGKADPDVERRIARARELGWDVLAAEALQIADEPQMGEVVTTKPDGTKEIKRGDMLDHRKLRIDTRLKLLAKWDPKRYGELLKHGNADGSNIDLAGAIEAAKLRAAGD